MGFRWRWPRRAVIGALVAGFLLIGGSATAVTLASRPSPFIERNVRIPVVDGPGDSEHVVLDASLFRPAGSGRLPAVLLAHGFGETKASVRGEAIGLARAGFVVLTWSARGFGRSTGQIALDSPNYEVKDTEQLISWLARQPGVLLDHPGDPRVGIAGASYGGAIALMTAGYDHRIDAVVPEITWNNLPTALFPNAAGGPAVGGVFKKQWAGLLFAAGTTGFGPAGPTGASVAQVAECGRLLPSICAMYQQAASLGRATPQAIAILRASSPALVAGRISAPTLLIQGENDSLFGLDQAAATYRQISANGTPADMVWFNGGHDGGNQESARIDGLTISWFDRWLKGPPWRPASHGSGPAGSGGGPTQASLPGTSQPGFSVSRNLGFDPSSGDLSLRIATAPAFPGLRGSRLRLVRLTGPPQVVVNPPGGAPPSMSAFPGLGLLGGGSSGLGFATDMPGQSAAFQSAPLVAPLQVTGAPTVRIRVSGPAGLTLFAKVYDVDQAGNATLPFSLAAPLRVSQPSAGREVTVTLPTMDYQFPAGHRIRLVLTATDFGYATPAPLAVYQVALAGPGVVLPSDPALVLQNAGLAWWVWAAPIAAVAVAAVLLLSGRRRRAGHDRAGSDRAGSGADPDVPLAITGLTKRYRDGQLAVDGLDLRVERSQILGLLGPNGAGKTTTLRALMGLIQPDAGTITIFGRRVTAGSAALSRLGAFVEGPGFLPHLSGQDNLELYWRAIGRPSVDPHLAEVLAIAGLGSAVDRKVRGYSRGMCQRLAIAQAMLGLPDLLVLDEPLNGLDPPQIREMRDVLIGYAAGGRAVILSSHMLGEVEQTCTHVVVMHNGRPIAAGPVAEIIGDGGSLLIGTPQVAEAVAVLGSLDGVASAETHPDGVLVHPGDVAASELVAALVGAGIPVDRVAPSRRLEEAFLALIGPVGLGGAAGAAGAAGVAGATGAAGAAGPAASAGGSAEPVSVEQAEVAR